MFFENNHHVLLKITSIYAQDNSGSSGDSYIFPPFEEDSGTVEGEDREDDDSNGGGDGTRSSSGGGSGSDSDSGSSSNGGGSGSYSDSGSSSNGGSSIEVKGNTEERGNEERINENTNNFSPLSSSSPNTDDKANPNNEVNQTIGQQSEQLLKSYPK